MSEKSPFMRPRNDQGRYVAASVPPHGTPQRYWRGCKCLKCKRAYADYASHARAWTRYSKNGTCQCKICKDGRRHFLEPRLTGDQSHDDMMDSILEAMYA